MPYSIRCLIYMDINLKSVATLKLDSHSSRNFYPEPQDVHMTQVD